MLRYITSYITSYLNNGRLEEDPLPLGDPHVNLEDRHLQGIHHRQHQRVKNAFPQPFGESGRRFITGRSHIRGGCHRGGR